jgi:2'-5' RNA ligase
MFCAIELPQNVRTNLENYVRQLRAATVIPASWTRVDNIHLTLKFFGNVAQAKVGRISAALARATLNQRSFQIQIGKTGTFPPNRPPKVLWIGVSDASHSLFDLHHSIELECEKEDFAREERPYSPHLTIARLRTAAGTRELGKMHLERGFDPIDFEARELILFRSELSNAGSRYTVISRHEFKPGVSPGL